MVPTVLRACRPGERRASGLRPGDSRPGAARRPADQELLAGQPGRGAVVEDDRQHALVERFDDRPLLMAIDRLGAYTPFAAAALTSQSVAAIVRAHQTGKAPVHRQPPARPLRSTVTPVVVAAVDNAEVELDQGYYDRGIAGAATPTAVLRDVTDILDGLDGRGGQAASPTCP